MYICTIHRVRTEIRLVFQTPGQNYFFPDFSGHFVHLYVNKNIKKLAVKCWNFLRNVFFCSNYPMALEFLNFELQMLRVMNCKKIINKCMGNQQCNWHLHFPAHHYSSRAFFHTFPYLLSFSRIFRALKISTLNSRTFQDLYELCIHCCTNLYKNQNIFMNTCSEAWTLVLSNFGFISNPVCSPNNVENTGSLDSKSIFTQTGMALLLQHILL